MRRASPLSRPETKRYPPHAFRGEDGSLAAIERSYLVPQDDPFDAILAEWRALA